MTGQELKQVISRWSGMMMDLAKVFALLGSAVKKAEKEGYFDNLETLELNFLDQGTRPNVLQEAADPAGVCPHDHEGMAGWEDLGHGFHKCAAVGCGAIRQAKPLGDQVPSPANK